MQATPGALVAGYRIIRRIGQGTHGAVYLAQLPDAEAGAGYVALKLVPLPPLEDAASGPAREAFTRSVATARRLQHPGIVALYAAGFAGDTGWMALEPVPGGDLSRHTQQARLLPEPLAIRVCARVADALAYAHRHGVVHRDVKPANVLVNWRADAVKLADFGLARADDGLQTGTGIVLGSPAYMAPEQLAGQLPSPKSDLYALGATLFQLLAGRLPHEGASMGELLRRVAEDPTPDLNVLCPDLPAGLCELVTALLAKNPAHRPADAGEAARLLDAIANSVSN